MKVYAGRSRREVELGIADGDDAIETARGSSSPSCGWARGGGFEGGQYGGQGGVVVAYPVFNGTELRLGKRQGRYEEALPVKASSGRTSRSRFCGEAASSRVLARVIFSGSLPSSGLNCRQAMRMLREKMVKVRIGLVDEALEWEIITASPQPKT